MMFPESIRYSILPKGRTPLSVGLVEEVTVTARAAPSVPWWVPMVIAFGLWTVGAFISNRQR